MRVLSRIFGGLLVAVTILFAGTSSSFAEMPDDQKKCLEVGYQWDETQEKCCIYYDPIKWGCITDGDWSSAFGEEGCDSEAGYIDDNGNFHCCPGGIGDSSTHLCCTPPEVFDIAQEKCVMSCPYDWYWDESTGQCCVFYYYDKKQDGYVCVTEEEFKDNIFPDIEGICENPPYDNGQNAGYVDENGEWHCCPEGSIPNDTTHQCECDDPKVFDPVTGQCIEPQPTYICPRGQYYSGKGCETCQAGYYCPGDDTAYQCPAGQYSSTTGAVGCSNISAGYYGSLGATSATGNGACVRGSYSAAGASGCTACSNGYTTSGTGSTSSSACTACSNNANVTSWVGQSWSPNTVSHLCEIASNGCASGYERTGSSPYACTLIQTQHYTITLNDNGGSGGSGAIYTTYGTGAFTDNTYQNQMTTSANPVAVPTKTGGYAFLGYYDAQSGGNQIIDGNGYVTADGLTRLTNGYTGNATIWARWSSSCYVIPFDNSTYCDGTGRQRIYTNKGSGSNAKIYLNPDCTGEITTSNPIPSAQLPGKEHGTFEGYYTVYTPNGATPGVIRSDGTRDSIVDETLILYTPWIATCSCNTGWQGSGNFAYYDSGGMVGWSGACTQGVTVTLNNNGGNSTGYVYTRKGTTSTGGVFTNFNRTSQMTTGSNGNNPVTVPTRTGGYEFAGYYSAPSGGTQYIDATGHLTSAGLTAAVGYGSGDTNVSWYAHWNSTGVTVTLDTNGATDGSCTSSVSCTIGSSCALPAWNEYGNNICDISKGEKVFMGWTTTLPANHTSSTTGTFSITGPSSSTTYYAVWQSPTSCTVTNSSSTAWQNTEHNQPRCLAQCNLGYGGHYDNTYTGNVFTGDEGTLTVNANCGAIGAKTYYNKNGGSGTNYGGSDYWEYGSTGVVRPYNYSGHVFTAPTNGTFANWKCRAGWLNEANQTYHGTSSYADCGTFNSGTASITDVNAALLTTTSGNGALTFFACWQFNINFKEANGTSISTDTYNNCEEKTISTTPTKNGYTFVEWCTNSALTNCTANPVISAGSTGTKTYYAKWTPTTYNITYNLPSGAAFGNNTTHPDTYNIETASFTISRPTYALHDFSGWDVSTAPTAWGSGSSSTGALDFTVATGTYGDIVLTANFGDSTITCSSGEYLPAGATSCSACLAGYRCPSQQTTYYYNANNAQGLTACSNSTQYQNETGQTSCKNVSTGYYKQSNSAQHICPTGYQSGPGAANESGCLASCAAGERVAEVNAECSSPASNSNDGWFSAAHNVYYGNLSPVSYCMLGYVNTATGSAKHNSVTTCRNTIDAGYYISNNKIDKVTAIRVVAPSNAAVNILELAAYTNPEGDVIDNSLLRNGNSGIAATGAVASGTGAYATNNNWTDNRYTTVNAGGAAVWVLQSLSELGSLRLALKPNTRVNVRIDVQINNNNWVQVFNQQMVHDKAIVQANMGELIVLTGLPTVCGGGTYRISGAVGLGDTPSCSTLGANYYSSGGGTSATPSSTGNGCLSGYTCGQCPSGYRDSSATGKTAASDCKANITLNKNGGTGTVNGTTGTASATKECSYGVSCSFGSASLVPTSGGYKFTGGWGTTDTCDSSTTSFSNPTGTYYACINSCSYTNSSAATPSSNVCAGTCDTGYSTSGGSNTGTAASCSDTECSCLGKNYTVTLDKNGGSGGTSTVTATFGDPMPTITLPSSPHGYENFSGYFDSNSNMYYDSAGESARNWDKAQNATLTASWSGEGVSCSPGYYLPANQSACNTACPSGYYCPGNQSYAVSSSNQGLIACPPRQSNDLGNSTVSVGSDANASAVTNCFIQWLPDGCAESVAPKNYGGGVNITTIHYSEKVKVYAQNDGTGGQDAYPTDDQYIYPAKLYSLPGYRVVPNGSYNGVSNAVTIPEISQTGHKGLYGIVGKSCTACTENSYGPGGGQVKWQGQNTVTIYGECKSCASGLTASTVNSTVYHDDAGDCGRILHIGTYEIRLKSIPSGFTVPSPSLRFDYDNDGTADFYARMSLNVSPMRVTSTQQISNPAKNFKTTYNNSTYYVCDDGTCH